MEIVLQQAKTTIEAHDARQQSARQEADALPTLTVLWPFHGPGRDFARGEEKITPELAERLTEWAQTIEAQAKGRTLTSMGYPQWPVFSLNGSSE